MENKIAVYTALFGGYDNVHDPLRVEPGVDYIMFTDAPAVRTRVWKVVKGKKVSDDPRRCARYYKAVPHKVLPGYKFWIWIDANVEFYGDAIGIVRGFLKKYEFVAFPHPARRCAYDEGKTCARLRLDKPELIMAQLAAMKELGYPKQNGLAETPLVGRRDTPKTRFFNDLWWDWMAKYCRRDQVSCNCAAWQTQLTIGYLPGIVNRNAYMRKRPHLKREKRVPLPV